MWKLNPRFMQACLELTRDPCWHYCGCAASTPLPCITAAALHIMLSLSNSFPCYLGCLQGTTQTYRQAFVLIKLVHMHVTCFLSLFEVVKHVWDHSKLDDMLFFVSMPFNQTKPSELKWMRCWELCWNLSRKTPEKTQHGLPWWPTAWPCCRS